MANNSTTGKTMVFWGSDEIEALLQEWAKEEDRSVSYIVRKCIEREQQRRRTVAGNRVSAPFPEAA